MDGLEFSKQCDEQCEVDNLNEPRLCKVCKLNVVLGDMLSCDFGRLDAPGHRRGVQTMHA